MAHILLLSIILECRGDGSFMDSDTKPDIESNSDDRESYRYNEYFASSVALNILFVTLCFVLLFYKMRNCSIGNDQSKGKEMYEIVRQQSESESDYDGQQKRIKGVQVHKL